MLYYEQGGDKYQQAFYVFEELAQAPATSSVRSLVSQAVAELHLGRTEEAQAALDQALKKEPGFADAIANQLVWSVITGQDSAEYKAYVTHIHLATIPDSLLSNYIYANMTCLLHSALEQANPSHPFLTDLAEKNDLFDKAATKYKAKVSA